MADHGVETLLSGHWVSAYLDGFRVYGEIIVGDELSAKTLRLIAAECVQAAEVIERRQAERQQS